MILFVSCNVMMAKPFHVSFLRWTAVSNISQGIILKFGIHETIEIL